VIVFGANDQRRMNAVVKHPLGKAEQALLPGPVEVPGGLLGRAPNIGIAFIAERRVVGEPSGKGRGSVEAVVPPLGEGVDGA
jgi:hypothetical protein